MAQDEADRIIANANQDTARDQEHQKARAKKIARRNRLLAAIPRLGVESFLREAGHNHLEPMDAGLVTDFQAWQTAKLMKLGAVIQTDGWPLSRLVADDDPARTVGIATIEGAQLPCRHLQAAV